MRRVLFDGEAFIRHRRSGITRYLSELIHQFRASPALGVEPVTPYRWVANSHLADGSSDYTQIPLPGRLRPQLLGCLNTRLRRGSGDADLVHHSLYQKEALARWKGRRRVCTVHDFTFERFPELFGDTSGHLAAKAIFLERCDALICVSRTTFNDLERFHPGLDKPTFVVPHGVGEHFFEPEQVRIRRLPPRYLLYVGNRHPHKNVELLLRAFARVSVHEKDLHLVLVGAYLSDEDVQLRELGIARRTLRLKVSDRELPWLYHQARAFVFPSLYEGFGLPVLEAMAAGCPVAVADADALVELASEVALVFERDDPDLLAEQIERLLSDRALATRLREAGRTRARDFTWRLTAERTAAAYAQASA